ncbi:dihydroorotase [Polaribacter sp. HL-MS24]|uniref:dihydroorotase n=1 Tax=Polaribacter sp. HL-MS24 TaxID=3077735 RepID=UPI0029352BDF|nr:dihydroorotase [Polaribacter sp. HL-MS24]WOC40285.1 dihydroorotase [Polaribacter sp. HL-MS24]
MNTLLKSATIIDPSSAYHQQIKDILIIDGKITQIAENIPSKKEYAVISKDNLHVSTGWFDTSVSFGEPGFEERETIKNGLQVAAKSGFTAVAVNPNTNPIIDNKSAIEFLINKSKGFATSLYPIGALTQDSKGIDMAEMYDMQQSGAIAFGDYNLPIANDNLLKVALQYAQNFEGIIFSFPKNNSIASEGIANEGINSTRLGLKGAPALAEHIQISRDLFLLEYTGGKLHIPTISTKKSVELIKAAKNKGLDISCSVAVHHLVLTDDELHGFDSKNKVNPPLRTKEDTKALLKGVVSGVIDIITSDHNPIDIEHKKVEFSEAIDGTVGLESLFGALNSILNPIEFIEAITIKPRQRFGITIPIIAEGSEADLTLFNPEGNYTFSTSDLLSTSKNSIFIDKKLKGSVYGIIAKNQLILKQ